MTRTLIMTVSLLSMVALMLPKPAPAVDFDLGKWVSRTTYFMNLQKQQEGLDNLRRSGATKEQLAFADMTFPYIRGAAVTNSTAGFALRAYVKEGEDISLPPDWLVLTLINIDDGAVQRVVSQDILIPCDLVGNTFWQATRHHGLSLNNTRDLAGQQARDGSIRLMVVVPVRYEGSRVLKVEVNHEEVAVGPSRGARDVLRGVVLDDAGR